MIEVTRGTPTAATLANLYEVIRETMIDVYYTDEQAEELKQNKTNIFLKGGQNEPERKTFEHSNGIEST